MPNFVKQAQGGLLIPIQTDWKAITPDGLTTNLTGFIDAGRIFYRRVGDSLEMRFDARKDTNAGSGANDVSFTLPESLIIDLTKSFASFGYYGTGTFLNEGANSAGITPAYASSTTIKLWIPTLGRFYQAQDCAAGDYIGFNVTIPIQGWSSNGVIRGLSDITTEMVRGRPGGQTIPSGFPGQVLRQTRLRSAGISLTHATPTNITATALTLTPGVWQLFGEVSFEGSGTTSSNFLAGMSTESANFGDADTISVPTAGRVRSYCIANVGSNIATVSLNGGVINIGSNTTYYLLGYAAFSVGTILAYGNITGVRIA